MLIVNHVQAQENDDLQRLIDRLASAPVTRAASTVTDIDLSAYSTPRTATLYIRNGVNVRFINGTLTRAKSLTDAPLVQIAGSSILHVAENAIISGGNFYSITPIVDVADGELDVEGGIITGNTQPFPISVMGFSVMLKDNQSVVRVDGGKVEYLGQTSHESSLIINGGTFGRIELSGHVSMKGSIIAKISCGKDSYMELTDGTLESSSTLILLDCVDGQVVVRNVKSKETANCFRLGDGEDDKFILSYENNSLVVRSKSLDPVQIIEDVEPGTLPDRIPVDVRGQVEELTITGRLNGTDIACIRGMACAKLKKLDISECYIVEGGDSYVEIYGNTDYQMVHYEPINSEARLSNAKKMLVIPIGLYTENDVIGSCMFRELSTIEYLRLPNTVTYVQRYAFADCPNLKTVIAGTNIMSISYDVFENSNNVDAQFAGCKYLHEENGVVYNSNYKDVFLALPTISGNLTMRSSVDSIRYPVFKGQKNIRKVELHENLVHLAAGAFDGCSSLKEVKFPQSLCSMALGTFANCDLNVIDVSSTQLKSISGRYHSLVYPDFYYGSRSGAFGGNDNIVEVRLPATLESIGSEAFTSLKIQHIYSYAIVPPSIKAPYNPTGTATGFHNINFDDTSDSFLNINYETCVVHVPRGSAAAYRESSWDAFSNIIEDLPGNDPNYITDADWLQQRLDEIANEKPNEAVELTIADEGIALSHAIFVNSGCKVIIKGGKLTIDPSKFTADIVLNVQDNAEIELRDITIDFSNLVKPYFYFFINSGKLIIGQNVVYQNISTRATEGHFYSNRKGGNLTVLSGDVSFAGFLLYNEGTVVLGKEMGDGFRLVGLSEKPVVYGKEHDNIEMYNSCSLIGQGSLIVDAMVFNMVGGLIQGSSNSTLVAERTRCELGGGRLVGGRTYCNGVIGSHEAKGVPVFELQSERIDVTGESEIYVYGHLPIIYLGKDGIIKGHVIFGENQTRNLTIDGDWSDMIDGKVLINPISEDDFKKLSFTGLGQFDKVYYNTSDNTVRYHRMSIQELAEQGVTSEDDLQKLLDMIAEQKPSSPVVVNVRKEGIILTHSIIANNGCKVIIKGGTIKIAELFQNDAIFCVNTNADVRFEDISLDLNQEKEYSVVHFFNLGQLVIGSNTRILAERLNILGMCVIYGDAQLPTLYLQDTNNIFIASPLQNTWIIDGDWKKFNVESAYTVFAGYNYTIQKGDFGRMQFSNMPDGIEAAYDEIEHVVVLKKKTAIVDVLQCIIDGGTNCIPDVTDVGVGTTDIGCEDPLQCAVDNATFDGGVRRLPSGELYFPYFQWCGCAGIGEIEVVRVNQGFTLTVRNYNFEAQKYDNQYIFVCGKLIIDKNVFIYHFRRFVHVTAGGHLVWRGGHTEDVDEPIYNEGGVVEIEGGNIGGDIRNQGGELTIHDGTTIAGNIWTEADIKIGGSVNVKNIYIKQDVHIYVNSKPTVVWNIHFTDPNEIGIYTPIIVGGGGYQLTEEDLKYFHFELPEGYRCIFVNGTIVIVRIVYNVETITEYLDYFGPMGTLSEPKKIIYDIENITIEREWHIKQNFHLLFDVGSFTMAAGDIYIDEGASLWLKNIHFINKECHIYVFGTLYIDEGVSFDDVKKFIHLCKGGQIHFVAPPTEIVNIFISEENIVTYQSVITDIEEEWLQYFNIELPDGYCWAFMDGSIVILCIPYNVTTLEEYIEYFGPRGTKENPWSLIYNKRDITIEREWYIKRNFHLLFDEGFFNLLGGDIHINEGASLWLKNIHFFGSERHIYVSGSLVIDENVDWGNISRFVHLQKGGAILVKKPLTSLLHVVVEEVTHNGILSIIGLTEEDLNNLVIFLPDGYTWKYNTEGGTIVVKEISVTVTAKSYTREYGEANPTLEYEVSGAALEGQPEISCDATATSPVGTYPIVIKKGGVNNYNDTYINGTLTITKAPLKVTVADAVREQGVENPVFEIAYDGWKNGEDESVLTVKPAAMTAATPDSPEGVYDIVVSGGEAWNYELTYVNGKLTVTVPSGIVEVASGQLFDVYTTSGTLLRKNTNTLKRLAKGVYVVNGRKVIVK